MIRAHVMKLVGGGRLIGGLAARGAGSVVCMVMHSAEFGRSRPRGCVCVCVRACRHVDRRGPVCRHVDPEMSYCEGC